MSISEALGERSTVEIPAGTIEYRERGSGAPIVFVHGIVVNGDLWRDVVPELAGEYRCIVPDLPLGSHSTPMKDDADLSLPGLAALLGDFLAALSLEDVTIVANDTGGAISQWLVSHQPERVGRLVLTSCDAFDNFFPPLFSYLKPAARLRPMVWLTAKSMRLKFVERLPIAFGWATNEPMPKEIARSYVGPIGDDPAIRRDFAKLVRAVDKRYTHEAAAGLHRFDKPALVVWGADDKFFPLDDGRRLAELLPQGRFETIAGSRAFIPEDQPKALAKVVREFLAERSSAGAAG